MRLTAFPVDETYERRDWFQEEEEKKALKLILGNTLDTSV
jgi:hypothetical protein